MIVETVPFSSDNYAYLIVCEQTGRAAAVDPAQPAPVLARVEQLGVSLTAIWNTHHHWDHTGGNEELLARGTLEVVGAKGSAKIPGLNRELDDGEQFEHGSLKVRVLRTPGHTLDGVVFWVEDAAFTGDALFGAGCGRLFEGDAQMLYHSLNRRLAQLPDDTRIFFGHEYTQKNLAFAVTVEPDNAALQRRVRDTETLRSRGQPSVPSSWALEKATNPFLRCDSPEIKSVLAARDPAAGFDDPVAVFAKLRTLRNSW